MLCEEEGRKREGEGEEREGGREGEGGGEEFVDSTWKKRPSREVKRNWRKVMRSPDAESPLLKRGERERK
jgi:hypothetical protein